MTLIYKLELDILQIYLHKIINVPAQNIQNLDPEQDIQTHFLLL